ncbi:hypothetical protein [Engelhardtia mirabilis]|uniref:Outer membrane protein assembly factor BamB n=1 Tax=Engelhardtia mirabilis TaxID=2528011 RepID=A0A518BDW7_9BACT|nr:hypothetical protein Pla133_02430 [Planctomycetes bacterium Pla133]QDU99505.1 hypothetical protein Pla86_02430 [Planctomycetes bacterium Pla86]
MQVLRSLLLAGAAAVAHATLAPSAQAQIWTVDIGVQISTMDGNACAAVSEGGRFASIYPYRTDAGDRYCGLTTYEADGQVSHHVALSSFDGGQATFYDSMFVDEQTLVVCGSVEGQPYMAAINVATGLPTWERSLVGSGKLTELTRNHLGQYIAMGDYTNGPSYDVVVMAVGSTGTLHWFRDYGVEVGNNFVGDIATAANGDLFMLYTSSAGTVVVRTTEWGHTIWSARYTANGSGAASMQIEATADDGLLICGWWIQNGVPKVFTMRLDGSGGIEWSHRYEIADTVDQAVAVSSLDLRADGRPLIGLQLHSSLPSPYPAAGVMALDASGNVEWVRRYSIGGFEKSPSVEATPEGGFFLATSRNNNGLRTLRGNSQGDVGDCVPQAYVNAYTTALIVQKTDQDFTYQPYPHGSANLHTTPVTAPFFDYMLCQEDCRVLGDSYGQGTAGTFGIVPTLKAEDGLCLAWGPELTVGAGIGGGLAYLGLSLVPAEVPMLGGTIYLNPATMVLLPPMVLGGTAGVPGVGSATLPVGGDLSGLVGATLHCQAFLPDAGAPGWLAMTPAATLTIQ